MRISIGGIVFRVSPWLLPYAGVAVWLGQGYVLAGMLCSVAIHELAHALAARALSLEVPTVSLTPFGGVARIEGLESSARSEVWVALAGPFASLLIAMAIAFMHPYLPFSEVALRSAVQWNLMMFALNLLPGLPLDGGRVMRALLVARMGLRRATRIASIIGMIIGAVLMGLAAFGAVLGAINLTLVAAGLYLALAAWQECRAAGVLAARELVRKRERSARGEIMPVRHIAAAHDTPVERIAARSTSRQYQVITVLDDAMRPIAQLDEAALLHGLGRPGTTLGDLARRCGEKGRS